MYTGENRPMTEKERGHRNSDSAFRQIFRISVFTEANKLYIYLSLYSVKRLEVLHDLIFWAFKKYIQLLTLSL